MADTLPYMKQLPLDYARSQIPPSQLGAAAAQALPDMTAQILAWQPSNVPVVPPIPPVQSASGVWVGTSPPSNPNYGWLWLNSNNNGLYTFGDPSPGVWSQVGTNW